LLYEHVTDRRTDRWIDRGIA